MAKKSIKVLIVAIVIVAIAVVVMVINRHAQRIGNDVEVTEVTSKDAVANSGVKEQDTVRSRPSVIAESLEPSAVSEIATAEVEDKDEKLVEAFDVLTDKWMETEKGIATLADVPPFVAAFKALPQERQDECIHRALNLIPDENIMLLVGVLMDKSVDPEIVETVFSDILNRDEAVKQPIMKEIYKDKTHKCWADVAWILDVTGDT